MRRFIVLTILIILMSHVTQAQDLHRFEIGISGGGPDWMLGYVGGAESHFSLIGELKYTPVKWVSIGLLGGVHDRQPRSDIYSPEERKPGASTTYDCNLMLMLYGNWFTRERLNIYSGVGYGTTASAASADDFCWDIVERSISLGELPLLNNVSTNLYEQYQYGY